MRLRRSDVVGMLPLLIVLKRLYSLTKTPVFWVFTLFGNACIVGGALLFQRFESPTNPVANEFLECLIWAVGIVTAVGASSLQPTSFEGKILMIFMMIGGALFLWSYMALFISALVDPELRAIEKEVSELQAEEAKSEDEIFRQLKALSTALEVKLSRSPKK